MQIGNREVPTDDAYAGDSFENSASETTQASSPSLNEVSAGCRSQRQTGAQFYRNQERHLRARCATPKLLKKRPYTSEQPQTEGSGRTRRRLRPGPPNWARRIPRARPGRTCDLGLRDFEDLPLRFSVLLCACSSVARLS